MLNPDTPTDTEIASAPPARAGAASAGRGGGNGSSIAGPPRKNAAGDGMKSKSAADESPEAEAEPAPNPVFAWIAQRFHDYGQAVGTYLMSTVFHALLAIIFGMIMLDPATIEELSTIFVSTVNEDEEAKKNSSSWISRKCWT